MENPVKGDWADMCGNNLRDRKVEQTLEENKNISDYKFKRILKEKIKMAALPYLTNKQRSKGGEINYPEIKMADYLSPMCDSTIDVKRDIFKIRNRMANIPNNFSSNKCECICGYTDENMKYIYSCKLLRSDEAETEYENVYSNNIEKILEVQKRFDENMKKRENLLKEIEDKEKLVSHAIQPCDPLYLVYSNG